MVRQDKAYRRNMRHMSVRIGTSVCLIGMFLFLIPFGLLGLPHGGLALGYSLMAIGVFVIAFSLFRATADRAVAGIVLIDLLMLPSLLQDRGAADAWQLIAFFTVIVLIAWPFAAYLSPAHYKVEDESDDVIIT